MLPSVAAAWIRPTTRPVTSSELSESFTIIGVIVPSSTEGSEEEQRRQPQHLQIADQLVRRGDRVQVPREHQDSPEAIALSR